MNIGSSLMDIGQKVGGAIQRSNQQAQQEQEQGDIEAFMRQAMDGDPVALKELMIKSPPAARMVAEHIQSQQAGQQAEQDRFTGEIANNTAGFIEQMHLAPQEQQEAMFNAAIDDPRYDIDEDDRNSFMDVNARKAIIGQVKGKEYAESFFGKQQDPTKFQQGTGDMVGHVFNPDNGTFSINPDLKAKLEKVKAKPTLDFKDRQALNKDFTALTKDTKLIRNTAKDLDKLSKMVGSNGNVSGPSSIAMVFKFMKALDPTSVVRESEFATAENSSGVPENMRNMYNKLMQGGKLGPKQVEEFVSTAKGLSNSAIDSSTSEITGFLDTFEGTIPTGFRKALLKRIPERFNVGVEPTKKIDTTSLSDEDLVNQYSGDQ